MRHFSRSQFHATESAAVNMSSKNSQMPAEDLTQPLARASRQMRLLTACGAVIVAVIVGATATLAINMRASALVDTERELGNVSLILAEQIAQSFQAVELVEAGVVEHMRSLRVESDDDFERLLSGPSTYQMLADKISGLSQIEAITLINGHGRLINSSRHWPIPQIDVTDRDYFRTLRDDPRQIVFLSEPLQSRVTGAWTVFLARKLVSSDGKFLGLVLGALRLQYFEGYFHALSLGQDASISLFRRDGMLLARHPHQDPKIGQIYPLAIPTVDKADSAVIRRVSVLDGIERMIVTRHIRDFPAIVGVSATVSAAVADAERDALRLSGAGGAMAFSVGLLVFLIARGTVAHHKRAQHTLEQQQKKLEEQQQRLEQQQKKLDAALNNMSQGLVMFEPDGRIALCNDRYGQMYGLSCDATAPGCELLDMIEARKAAGTFSGDPREYCTGVMAAVADGGSAAMSDTPDGRTIYVINRPMVGGGWVATHEDVTERRLMERERDRNRDFLDLVIENVPVMIVVKDARDLRYVLLNRASEERLGFSPREGIGKCAREVFAPDIADRIEAADHQSLMSRQPLVIDDHVLDLPIGGQRIQKTTRVPILGEDGEPQYLLIVAEDITERKTVERQLQQAVKMEAVGQLTGGIAHDFNNLLMVMIGNLDLLAVDVADDPEASEKVETILQASLNGAELTRQMLAFARRQPLNPKCVKVDELIGATAKLLGRTLGADVAIEVRVAEGLWPVRVDESQLQSSIVNAAINGRDAMPGGGTLIVEAGNITVDRDTVVLSEHMGAGGYVVISISDTGTGISPEQMARVFEPFFTTKAHGKGSGLGLSMVYGFARQSGGHVGIYSEVGRGTTLKLYLPRTIEDGQQYASAPLTDSVPLGGGEVILAVDDNKNVLATVVRQLTDLGYNVVTAGSAFSALRMFEDGLTADLLFTDVVMPGGLSGKDLADEALRRYPNLKILLTSGFTDAFLANDAVLHSKYNLLTKPYRKHDLARAVWQALDHVVAPVESSAMEPVERISRGCARMSFAQ